MAFAQISKEAQEFFELRDPLNRSAFRLRFIEPAYYHHAPELLQGKLSIEEPPVLEVVSGQYPAGFLWSDASIPLVDSRVASALKESRLSGWHLTPAVVHGSKADLGGFFILSATGRSGPFDKSKRIKYWAPPKSPLGKGCWMFKGHFIPTQSWDGSDFFVPADTHGILHTPRAKKLLDAISPLNVDIVPASEAIWSDVLFEENQNIQ